MISTSSSNWLDRLRSSRGFPTGDQPGLDRFLSSSSSSGSAPTPNDSITHSESTQSLPPIPTRSPQGEFNGVLCHLFNMGEKLGESSSRNFSLKASRKQPNPRFCKVMSSNANVVEQQQQQQQQPSMVLSNNGKNKKNDVIRVDEKDELKEYTRSEVTIIDTSFDVWKCDKWVFRKNDEWKIKDKKGKSSGKKRKMLVSKLGDGDCSKLNGQNDNENNIDNDNDKLKMIMTKNKRKREVKNLLMHQNKEQPKNDKEGEPSIEREDLLSKLPRKRFPCPRPPKQVRNESSPVVLVKYIPPSNVKSAIKPGKAFHKKCPKQMKLV